jgi:hypothetical protein
MKSDRWWECPACLAVNAFLEEVSEEERQTCENCEDMYLPIAHEVTWEEFSAWCRSLKG